jgi:hypothetical protein
MASDRSLQYADSESRCEMTAQEISRTVVINCIDGSRRYHQSAFPQDSTFCSDPHFTISTTHFARISHASMSIDTRDPRKVLAVRTRHVTVISNLPMFRRQRQQGNIKVIVQRSNRYDFMVAAMPLRLPDVGTVFLYPFPPLAKSFKKKWTM